MGSVIERTRTRAGKPYIVYRAQAHDPRVPVGIAKNIEKMFDPARFEGKDLRARKAAAKREAQKWVDEQEDAAQDGTWRDKRKGITVRETADEWAAQWGSDKSEKTRVAYRAILAPAPDGRHTKPLDLYITGRWGDRPIASIVKSDVAAWLEALKARHQPQSTLNAFYVLRGLFAYAVDKSYVAEQKNPVARGVAYKLPSKTKDRTGPAKQLFLEPSELRALVEHLPERWQDVVWVCALLGTRAGETWGLTHADVDVKRKLITIRRAIKDVGGHLIVGSTKTDDVRTISIPDACLPELKRALNDPGVYRRGVKLPSQPEGYEAPKGFAAVVLDPDTGKEALGTVEDRSDARRLLYTTRAGSAVSENNFLRRVFQPAVRSAVEAGDLRKDKFIRTRVNRRTGVREEVVALRVHDLRHSGAAFVIEANNGSEASLAVVMHRLGHKNIRTTFDRRSAVDGHSESVFGLNRP